MLIRCSKYLALIFLVYSFNWLFDLSNIGKVDFVQYWAASRLFLEGSNPYDPSMLRILQHSVLNFPSKEILIWNPPIVFPLILVLYFFSFNLAAKLWLVVNIVLIISSCFLMIKQFGLKGVQRGWFVVFCMCFSPFFEIIYWGQLSAVIAFAAILSWYYAYRDTNNVFRVFLAGVIGSVTFLKPHLLYLIYLQLLFHLKECSIRTYFYGLLTGVVALCLIAIGFKHDIFQLYFAAMEAPPIYWQTPTLGSWLQRFTAIHSIEIRFLPSIISIILLSLFHFFIKRGAKYSAREVLLILTLSILTSPYGWLYDQILLLPVVAFLFSRFNFSVFKDRVSAGSLVGVNLLTLIFGGGVGQEQFVWYPILIAVVLLSRLR